MLSFLPKYTHIINTNLKHIYLRFDIEGNLIIKSPGISRKELEQLLLKKASWINRARDKMAAKKGKPADFSMQNSILYYLGEAYPLQLVSHRRKGTSLSLETNRFVLAYSIYDENLFHQKIDLFYKEAAKKYLPQEIEAWAKKMRLSPAKITFRKTRRQWGSCSAHNRLSFNTMMMKLPLHLQHYIIVHELAHIQHKHHQHPFWELVSMHLPDYKALIAELKTYQ